MYYYFIILFYYFILLFFYFFMYFGCDVRDVVCVVFVERYDVVVRFECVVGVDECCGGDLLVICVGDFCECGVCRFFIYCYCVYGFGFDANDVRVYGRVR